MGRAKRGVQIGVGVVVFLAVVLIAAGFWISRTPGHIAVEYTERAQVFQERSWTRPAPTGWSLEEGEADVLYQAAVDDVACSPWLESRGQGREVSETLSAVEKAGFPEPCGLVCDAIKACGPAFQVLLRGTRASSARSPAHLWSTWHVDAQGLGDYIGLIRIAQLLLADAGRRDDWNDVAAVVRYAQDLTRGGGLISAMLAVVIHQNAHTRIREALEAGKLDEGTRAMLRRELRYVDTQELGMGFVWEAEMLQAMATFLGDIADAPPQSLPPPKDFELVRSPVSEGSDASPVAALEDEDRAGRQTLSRAPGWIRRDRRRGRGRDQPPGGQRQRRLRQVRRSVHSRVGAAAPAVGSPR